MKTDHFDILFSLSPWVSYLLQAELDKENDYFMRHASPIRDEFDDEDEYMMTTGLVTNKILFANLFDDTKPK